MLSWPDWVEALGVSQLTDWEVVFSAWQTGKPRACPCHRPRLSWPLPGATMANGACKWLAPDVVQHMCMAPAIHPPRCSGNDSRPAMECPISCASIADPQKKNARLQAGTKETLHMNFIANPATVASFDSDAAECAAALIRPAFGFRSAQYDPHAEVFQRLSLAQVTGAVPIGIIEKIVRERNGVWRWKSRCPFCEGTHMHGGGAGPVPSFGARDADCGGGGYAPVAVPAEVAA